MKHWAYVAFIISIFCITGSGCMQLIFLPTNKYRNSGPACSNIWYPAQGEGGRWSCGSPIRQGDVWFDPGVVDTPVTDDILNYRGCGQTGGYRHCDTFMLIYNIAIVRMMICIYINMCPKNHHNHHIPHIQTTWVCIHTATKTNKGSIAALE